MEIKLQDIDLINELYNLNLLINSHRSVLTQCINSKCDTLSKSFQAYQNKYNDYCQRFKEKKQEVKIKYIIPNISSNKKYTWQLNYETGVITINFQ